MKTLALATAALAAAVTQVTLRGLTPEEAAILSHMSLEDVPDGQGGMVPTLVVTGLNVQIVNGLGQTHAIPNGAGNLILGYNETGNVNGDDRTGSHYLVFGSQCNYAGAAGLIGGQGNRVDGLGAAIVSGHSNGISAGTSWSMIAAGALNSITGDGNSFIGAGVGNSVSSQGSAIVGGRDNTAGEGPEAVVGGGQGNAASGPRSVVSGGVARSAGGMGSWAGGMFYSPN